MAPDDRQRGAALFELANRAASGGLTRLHDRELLLLLAEHRWAVGRLASRDISLELRSLLTAAVLKTHGLLHARRRERSGSIGRALLRIASPLAISSAIFFGAGLVAFVTVISEPLLAYGLVPRAMLSQIDASSWGARAGPAADIGMTLFYWGNNLRATLFALALGMLGGIPALLPILFNGAMLGAVAAVAVTRDAGIRLLAWTAPHGIPELGALVLCGAIGLELGRSWLEPGVRPRRLSLAECGRELAPLIVVAAILVLCAAPLEGFVAPLDLHPALDVALALGWVIILGAGARRAVLRARASS